MSTVAQLDTQRLEFSMKVVAENGQFIPAPVQKAILSQVVILGMPPYEASLAAGAYSFEVKPDPAKWPPGVDPNKVIAAQSRHPDQSEIRMMFKNATQFGDGKITQFKVYFKNGKAQDISRLDTN